MALRLKINSGPLQGKEFSITPGAVIGRASSEITVSDPKISGRHAKIEKSATGQYFLIDLGSKSAIRQGEQKLFKLELTPGTTFTLGKTLFEVLADLSEVETAPPPLIPPKLNAVPSTLPEEISTKNPIDNLDNLATPDKHSPPKNTPSEDISFSEYLAHFASRARNKINDEPIDLLPFEQIVELNIQTGLQAGTRWLLGYGPRDFGLGSLDHPLFEDGTPPFAFKITPSGASALFSTEHPEKIRLNGRAASAETLMAGDEIIIGSTTIKVSFKE